jgi:hypothetical protein
MAVAEPERKQQHVKGSARTIDDESYRYEMDFEGL